MIWLFSIIRVLSFLAVVLGPLFCLSAPSVYASSGKDSSYTFVVGFMWFGCGVIGLFVSRGRTKP